MPLPSYSDILEAGLRSLQIRPSRFTREQAEEEESTANTVMNVQAAMVEETAVFLDQSIQENQLGPAMRIGGTVLDRLALDRYGDDFEPRQAESVAVAVLEVRREGTEGFAWPKGSRVASGAPGAQGIIFRTTNDLVFGPGEKGPLEVFAYAMTAGPDGNVAAGTISTVLDKPAEDSTLTATNPDPATGGGPREEDGPLGGRIQGYWRSARRGTKGAVEYGCKTTPGVGQVTVEEVINPFTGMGAWRGRVIVADMNGSANAAMTARVVARLDEFRALGAPVLVSGSTPVLVAIEVVGLAFAAGAITSELIEAIRAAIVATVNALTPGETLRIAAIQAAIEAFAPAVKTPANAVVVPAGDMVPPGATTSIKTNKGLVKINGQ